MRPSEHEGRERRTTRLCNRPRDRSAEQDRSPGQVRDRRATRQAIDEHLTATRKRPGDFLFRGRGGKGRCLSTREYARLLSEWIASIGLDPALFGTHSLRRTKATLIYRRTGTHRAGQLLLGHSKVESTIRCLGIEVDAALAIAAQIAVGAPGQSGHALPTSDRALLAKCGNGRVCEWICGGGRSKGRSFPMVSE